MEPRDAASAVELSALRRRISELVAQNAVPMVQQAIDAVREEGQYQAMKYLFEMIGLYPANTQDESPAQESLARILLNQLELSDQPSDETPEGKRAKEKPTASHPVE